MEDIERRIIRDYQLVKETPYYIDERNVGISEYIGFIKGEDDDLKDQIIDKYRKILLLDETSGVRIHKHVKDGNSLNAI